MKEIRLKFLYSFIFIVLFSLIIVLLSIGSQQTKISHKWLHYLVFLKYSIITLFWCSVIFLVSKIFPPSRIKNLIKKYAYIFLVFFIISGMVTFVYNFFTIFFSEITLSTLSEIEESLSLLTFFLGAILYIFASFFSVLPKRIFLPASFFLLITLLSTTIFRIFQTGAIENFSSYTLIKMFFSLKWYILIRLLFASIQIYLGLFAFKKLINLNPLKTTLFSTFHFVKLLFLNIFITITVSFTIMFFLLYSSINNISNGYLTLVMPSFQEISNLKILPKIKFVEKIYTKNNKDIHLVGIFDMGREDLYSDLIKRFDKEKTVLLRDIVTDSSNTLEVSETLQNIFREIGLIKNHNKDKISVKVIEANVDITELNPTTTTIIRNILGLFEPENFKIFFQKLISIITDILKYIKNTAHDFYSLKETGIGKNYETLQSVLKDDHSWDIFSGDIKNLTVLKNHALVNKSMELESKFNNIIILGGNELLENELKNNGYKLLKKNRHPFPLNNYKSYIKERMQITWILIKEVYYFIKENTWDEFSAIFTKN